MKINLSVIVIFLCVISSTLYAHESCLTQCPPEKEFDFLGSIIRIIIGLIIGGFSVGLSYYFSNKGTIDKRMRELQQERVNNEKSQLALQYFNGIKEYPDNLIKIFADDKPIPTNVANNLRAISLFLNGIENMLEEAGQTKRGMNFFTTEQNKKLLLKMYDYYQEITQLEYFNKLGLKKIEKMTHLTKYKEKNE
jgi:hypothetical protein